MVRVKPWTGLLTLVLAPPQCIPWHSFGGSGTGPGQLSFDGRFGGLCMTHRDSLLIAEHKQGRVQELWPADGRHERFIGDGVLRTPNYVDCNAQASVTGLIG